MVKLKVPAHVDRFLPPTDKFHHLNRVYFEFLFIQILSYCVFHYLNIRLYNLIKIIINILDKRVNSLSIVYK